MTYLRRTLHACTFLAVGAAGFFAPEALAFVNGVTAAPPTIPMPIERAAEFKPAPVTEQAAVRIELENSLGSGVSVEGGFIVTAAHVVGDAKDVRIKDRDGKEDKAEVLWANRTYDIALLRSDADIPAASLSCRTAHVGDAVMAVGNPLGIEFISSFGRIAGAPRSFNETWKSVFVTDLTVIMGNSGGPVFDDAGQVVGIVVGVLGVPTGAEGKSFLGLSTVVPSSVVCSLMGRVS